MNGSSLRGNLIIVLKRCLADMTQVSTTLAPMKLRYTYHSEHHADNKDRWFHFVLFAGAFLWGLTNGYDLETSYSCFLPIGTPVTKNTAGGTLA